MDDHTQILVCQCGVPVRIRERHFEIGGNQSLDWAPCPLCYRKLYQMNVEGVVSAELVSEAEWD
ncbi:Cysteine-rich KTR (plasmid) [Cupriavidus sp. H19C3]